MKTPSLVRKLNTVLYCIVLYCIVKNNPIQAQTIIPCYYDEMNQKLMDSDPVFKQQKETELQVVNDYLERQQRLGSSSSRTADETLIIPVVVHVIHDSGDDVIGQNSNISDEQIFNQIDALNDAFSNASHEGLNAVDTKIKFCLATKLPDGTSIQTDGSPFYGITRNGDIVTDVNSGNISDMFSLVNFPFDRYLNIYVLSTISLGSGYTTLGVFLAQPGAEGVLVRYDFFGNKNNCSGSCNLNATSEGKTLVHEVGHYLGLSHTFQGYCSGMDESSCLESGDGVCDTPPVLQSNFGCVIRSNSCHESFPSDLPDQIENYMDYTDDYCRNTFTQGQKERMFATIFNSIFRTKLISFETLVNTGCAPIGLYANFFIDPFTTTQLCLGENIIFHGVPNEIAGGPNTAVQYQWSFPGGFPETSSDLNPTVQYNSNGIFLVSLTVTDANNVSTSSVKNDFVFVDQCSAIISSKNKWYFGFQAGLDFSTGKPIADLGIYNSSFTPKLNTFMGTIVQCNNSGELLFYSNGYDIWDNNHELITTTTKLTAFQGYGLQTGISIKDPNIANANRYYLFSIPRDNTNSDDIIPDFAYTLIDATTSTINVESYNNKIQLPTGVDKIDNKITAIPHCNGLDYWIIVMSPIMYVPPIPNTFLYIYKLDLTGVNLINTFDVGVIIHGVGEMKSSPNGKKLAFSGVILPMSTVPYYKTVILDFNQETGTLSSPLIIDYGGIGVSFSPNSRFLYVNNYNNPGVPGGGPQDIIQFDLEATNPLLSKKIIPLNTNLGFLQIGPDNKIYIALESRDHLAVINYPDLPITDSNPNAIGFNLLGPSVKDPIIDNFVDIYYGLPNFVDFTPLPLDFTFIKSNCNTVNFYGPSCKTSYQWSFGDLDNSTSIVMDDVLTYPVTNSKVYYTVTLTVDGVEQVSKIISIGIDPPDLPAQNCVTDITRRYNYSTTIISDYLYSWSVSGGVIDYEAGDKSNIDVSWGATDGTLTLGVTDIDGCTNSTSRTVIVSSISAITTTSNTCFEKNTGTASVNVTGGTPPYTYLWTDGQTTQTVSNLSSDKQVVLIMDANGCFISEPITINQNPEILISSSITNTSCTDTPDGVLELTVLGGLSPYSFSWSTGETSKNINNLTVGSYTITITDANNCTVTSSLSISEPTPLGVTISEIPTHCNGGNDGVLNATVTGGASPYSFNWSNGAIVSNSTGLSAGTYTVTITDNNGCTISASSTISEPVAFSVTLIGTNLSCYGVRDGSLNTTVDGVTAPYSFVWSNGKTTANLTLLNKDVYTVTVTDNNGCTNTGSATLSMPAVLEVSATGTNITCKSGYDGTATAIANGGTIPYSFSWSNDASDENPTGLTAGNYTVTVTDYNGCTSSATVKLIEPSAITLLIQSNYASCNNGNDGSIEVKISGGSSPYSLIWSNGSINNINNELSAGTYTVTVSDANNCTVTNSTLIKAPSQITINHTITELSCGIDNNAAINLSVDGGIPGYSYSWSNTHINIEDIDNLTAGTYTVTVTDANSCTATKSITINNPFDIPNGGTVDNVTISDTWNSNMKIKGLVEVPWGGTLTINSATIEFAENSGIRVLPSGTLIVNNATLSNLSGCPQLWDGIKSESTPKNIQISNTSTIQGAIRGLHHNIYFDDDSHTNLSFNNCTFRNNQISIFISYLELDYFWSPNLGQPEDLTGLSNVFDNCTFEINNNHSSQITYPVEFLRVSGNFTRFRNSIGINNCTFTNSVTGLTTIQKPIAIRSNWAVKLTGNTFTDLNTGVELNKLNHLITGNTFSGVAKGIYLQGSKADVITNNTFSNIVSGDVAGEHTYGLMMVGCDAFNVGTDGFTDKPNTFRGYSSTIVNPNDPGSHAMVFENCAITSGEVFSNQIDETDYGIQTQGNNRNLKIRCNVFSYAGTAHKYAWYTVKLRDINGNIVGTNELKNQGQSSCITDPGDAAGNRWNDLCATGGNESDIFTEVDFNYFANPKDDIGDPTTFPFCSTPIWKTDHLNPNVTCADATNTSCQEPIKGIVPPPDKGCDDAFNQWVYDIRKLINVHRSEAKVFSDLLKEIILKTDGGNTRELIQKINKIPPMAAIDLRNRLLNALPLSDIAIKTIIYRRPALPPGMLREVLIPNSPLSEDIMRELRAMNPSLPPSVLKEIEEAQNQEPRFPRQKELRDKIEYQKGEVLLLENLLLREMPPCAKNNAIEMLRESPFPESRKTLAGILIDERDFSGARNELNNVTLLTASEEILKDSVTAHGDRIENENFCKFMNCMLGMAENNRTIQDVSTSELQTLREVVNSKTVVGVHAEIIITEVTGEKFEHKIVKAPITLARKGNTDSNDFIKLNDIPQNDFLRIIPNPFTNKGYIECFVGGNHDAELQLYDLLGKNILNILLHCGYNYFSFNMDEIKDGIYFYHLYKSHVITNQGKLIITK